jgi:hypothetical protein
MRTRMTRSVEDYIANLHAGQAAVVRALCEVIRRAAPEARESIKWAQPVWEVNGPVCSVKAFKSYTNVNFWRGAELAERGDPEGLLLGEGSQMRHLRVATVDEIRAESLRGLVMNAVDLNRMFGDPTREEATRARNRIRLQ